MRLGVWVVACAIFVGVGCKRAEEWANNRAASSAKQTRAPVRPVPALAGPGLAPGSYRIVDVRVEAEPLHGGRPWDVSKVASGPEPDIEIDIFIDGHRAGECRGPDDSFTARCRLEIGFELVAATQIELHVFDRDTVFSDVVGTAMLVDPSHWGTGILLPMATKDDLRAAAIVLEATPSWWEVNQIRVWGACVGIGVGLGILALFRRRVFALAAAREVPALVDEPLLVVAGAAGVLEVLLAAAVELGGLPGEALAVVFGFGGVGAVLTLAHVIHVGQLTRQQAGVVLIVASGLALAFVVRLAKAAALATIVLGLLALLL